MKNEKENCNDSEFNDFFDEIKYRFNNTIYISNRQLKTSIETAIRYCESSKRNAITDPDYYSDGMYLRQYMFETFNQKIQDTRHKKVVMLYYDTYISRKSNNGSAISVIENEYNENIVIYLDRVLGSPRGMYLQSYISYDNISSLDIIKEFNSLIFVTKKLINETSVNLISKNIEYIS